MAWGILVVVTVASYAVLDPQVNIAVLSPISSTILWAALVLSILGGARVFGVRLALLAVVGSALMAISAKTSIPLEPVPLTMQTFAVLVIAMAYGARLAGATLLLYLAEGAVGLPVFESGAGLPYMAGPTGGYLAGFLVAAIFVGWLAERGWDRSVTLTFFANTGGTIVIFALGVPWLAYILNSLPKAVEFGLAPFPIVALIKIALAAAVLPLVWKLAIRKRGA
ncbi:MAG: biotin transporter BioY [Alphaproteobacteria bacterium]|nr:biotin transporter BioY [Alphaproteobacteria bacterium]